MQDPSSFSQSNLTKPPEFGDHEQHLNCPRCHSTNTKFCYYNNYNLSQPRHYCKNCKRYWTKGGTLRNIPVGGTSRKDKSSKKPKRRPSCSNATTTDDPKSSHPYAINQQDGYGFNLSFGSVLNNTNDEFDNFNFMADHELGTAGNAESSLVGNTSEDFINVGGRESIGNGCVWPDLSIYTPPDSSLE